MSRTALCSVVRACLQAAAAAGVAGVGLGVMPLTSLALGIDPGFISLAGACYLGQGLSGICSSPGTHWQQCAAAHATQQACARSTCCNVQDKRRVVHPGCACLPVMLVTGAVLCSPVGADAALAAVLAAAGAGALAAQLPFIARNRDAAAQAEADRRFYK